MNKQEAIKKINLEMFAYPNLEPEEDDGPPIDFKNGYNAASKANIKIINQLDEPQKVIAQLSEKWHEDIGPVLWWDFPVEEPPYCGTPLDDDFPKYKTHFTELHIPDEVEEEPKWVLKHQSGMYFTRFNKEMEPLLGGEKRAYRFTDESKAEALTIFFNGTVEKV